jgi:hypothetical protein
MSLTVFLAFCILGCDFMLVVLFQWLYGEKHRGHKTRRASRNQAPAQSPLYYVHAKRPSQPNAAPGVRQLVYPELRRRAAAFSPSNAEAAPASSPESHPTPSQLRRDEELAYQRIISFTRTPAAVRH